MFRFLQNSLLLLSIVIILNSCLKDRLFPPPDDNNKKELQAGDLWINEILSGGSNQVNEFGESSDWFEIYNPSLTDTIFLAAGRWYFSDDLTNPTKYALSRDTFILPDSFLLIWCNSRDTIATEIHTNFSLSSAGEDMVLVYIDNTGNQKIIDSYSFGPIPSGKSTGRASDGAANWIIFDVPTPGRSNQIDTSSNPNPTNDSIPVGALKVNEIIATGSTLANEFGSNEDWFEIYNPSPTDTVLLKANKWEFRDDANTWILPADVAIPPLGFLIVFCDDQNTVATELHTNFKLGSGGDAVHLYYIPSGGAAYEIDGHVFGSQQSGVSIGRSPNGSNNWISLPAPSPGASNN